VPWNEQKADRFEDLRKRQDALSTAERMEFDELTKDLEGIESAIVNEATVRKLSRTSRPLDAEPEQQFTPWRRLLCLAYGLLLTLFLTVAASVFATSNALGWPLSEANMQYALIQGAVLGVVAGAVLGAVAAKEPAFGCLFLIGVSAVAWAAVTGCLFFVFVAGSAAC
jgi:hypothetical protein